MTSAEAARSPLEPEAVAAAAGSAWSVSLRSALGSTNVEAAASAVPGTVVVADHQRAGRGRLDRTWVTPPGTALTFSAVVDPQVPDARWPLLPLVAGLAVAQGVRRSSGLEVRLKWPNDVLVADRKVAGILVERVHGAGGPVAVVGIGVNVALAPEELPVPTATSMAIEGSDVSRTALLAAVLAALSDGLESFRSDPVGMLRSYRSRSSTLGRQVDVHLPDGSVLTGEAESIDDQGRLVVRRGDAVTAVGAGDVVHVRPAAR